MTRRPSKPVFIIEIRRFYERDHDSGVVEQRLVSGQDVKEHMELELRPILLGWVMLNHRSELFSLLIPGRVSSP